jgi:hypothetical protein
MTVRELIAELSKHDPDMIVAVYDPLGQNFQEVDGECMVISCKKLFQAYERVYGDEEKADYSVKLLVI